MIAELGHFALLISLMTSLVQASLPLFGANKNNAHLIKLGSTAALTSFGLVAAAFAALTYSFVADDFSVALVTQHSQTQKPLVYKITGVWANHEGSMLLWVLILTLFSALLVGFSKALPPAFKARVLGIQGMIAASFLSFLIFTSNPFARIASAPSEGIGMNPLLQDPGLAIHPPMLYMGYVGFSMAFSFAIAALIEGKVDANWARFVRPWVLLAWSFLTLGITLGSFWAYYILGWGGWWFWDPVENVSLMPWLVGTALLHSTLVVERRQALVNWCLLLAILTFSLSLLGTFVVRSGVLTSVHSFASDPGRGLFILVILIATTGGALTLFALRSPRIELGKPFALISRETGLLLNNVFLMVATTTVFFGTFWPLFIDMMGNDKISVGAGYFNKTFVPLFLPILFAMVIGPFLKWKRDTLQTALRPLRLLAFLSLMSFCLVITLTDASYIFTAIGLALSFWIIVGSLLFLARRIKLGQQSLSLTLTALRHTPRGIYGLILGHLGLGLVLMAITTISTWQQENILSMSIGATTQIGSSDVKLTKVETVPGPNYEATRGTFELSQNGQVFRLITAERRFYPLQQMQTNQTGIHTNLISNIYLALGDDDKAGNYTVRLYYHPLAPWLWFGGALMAFAGFISLTDRRFRNPDKDSK